MLCKLLKRSQDAFAVFHFNNSQDSVFLSSHATELNELAILGGRKSIITPRSASHSPAIWTANLSGYDLVRPSAAYHLDISADKSAHAPAMKNSNEFDMSVLLTNHGSHDHQELSGLPSFHIPSFESEVRNQPSALDRTFRLPDEGDLFATEMPGYGEDVIWSMFASQLLP